MTSQMNTINVPVTSYTIKGNKYLPLDQFITEFSSYENHWYAMHPRFKMSDALAIELYYSAGEVAEADEDIADGLLEKAVAHLAKAIRSHTKATTVQVIAWLRSSEVGCYGTVEEFVAQYIAR